MAVNIHMLQILHALNHLALIQQQAGKQLAVLVKV